MTNHAIKIDRARKLSEAGRFPGTFSAMLGAVPEETISAVSAQRLAELIDSIRAIAETSKRIALDDAAREGMLWTKAAAYDVVKVS